MPSCPAAAPAAVLTLAEGALQTMCVTRFKLAAALLLLAGLVTLAVGTCTREALAQRQAGAPAKEMPAKPPPRPRQRRPRRKARR